MAITCYTAQKDRKVEEHFVKNRGFADIIMHCHFSTIPTLKIEKKERVNEKLGKTPITLLKENKAYYLSKCDFAPF